MKEDSVIELWVAFDLLLKEPELQGLSSQVFSAEDDTRLYAFLLANLDDKLTEQEQVEILESFMGVVYQSAASVYESLPADNRRTKQLKPRAS